MESSGGVGECWWARVAPTVGGAILSAETVVHRKLRWCENVTNRRARIRPGVRMNAASGKIHAERERVRPLRVPRLAQTEQSRRGQRAVCAPPGTRREARE